MTLQKINPEIDMIKLYTIGFTKKDAESFFTLLEKNGIKKLIDIRLNNVSQLAGFTKKNDLKYLLRAICNIRYLHMPELAPTSEILNDYKKKRIGWHDYESRFNKILSDRKIERSLNKTDLDAACLLCSEASPEKCHRRLVAEYLRKKLDDIEIIHL